MQNKVNTPISTSGFTQKPISHAPKQKKWRGTAVFIFFLLFFAASLFGTSVFIFEKKYKDKVYPGIHLGAQNVSGFTQEELKKSISQFKTDLEGGGIIFTYKDTHTTIFPQIIATDDPDIVYELFHIDTDATVKNIFAIARAGNFSNDLKTKISLIKTPSTVPLVTQVFTEKITSALQENFHDLEIPAKNAELKINADLEVFIIGEEEGIVPDYASAVTQLEANLRTLQKKEIILSAQKDKPLVTGEELNAQKKTIEKLFAKRDELALSDEKNSWEISKNTYKDWIAVQKNKLLFNDKLLDYIKKEIAESVETPVEEARFTRAKDGKVREFKPSKEGRSIDYQKTQENINAIFFDEMKENQPIPLVAEIVNPKYTTESVNNLGIKELIGKGVSNFSGSPANRRHNISIGAETLNGLLVPPGEEFSLVQTLGNVDAQNGYLTELVIKGNRTIPEYGGGLCQIGTTLFRAALNSGLPITERRSHSYRVRYYEPAGVDCTIYTPHPDCRFVNDTGAYILIQTYTTEKDDLVFEFWGAKDGRSVVMTDPILYNITKPPPTKYVETEDMPEGETKCTERAHDGAEAKFNYTVSYPDGSTKEQTFNSYYRPWQAVCLVGKKKVEAETTNSGDVTATPTP